MRRISFYVDGSSILHRLHPSTKLVAYLVCFIVANILPWQMRWVMLAIVFFGLWFCGVPPWRYKVILFITAVSTLTVPLLNGLWPEPGDPIIFPLWGNVGFHRQGLENGLSFSGLYGAIGISTIAWLTTTRLWEITEAPTRLGVHHAVGFGLGYIFRYIPEVAMHYLDLADVWRTRGVNFGGWIWQRFWTQCRLTAALLILEFTAARSKAQAVESRGFSLSNKSTPYILPPIPGSERFLIWAMLVGTGIATLIRLITSIA